MPSPVIIIIAQKQTLGTVHLQAEQGSRCSRTGRLGPHLQPGKGNKSFLIFTSVTQTQASSGLMQTCPEKQPRDMAEAAGEPGSAGEADAPLPAHDGVRVS